MPTGSDLIQKVQSYRAEGYGMMDAKRMVKNEEIAKLEVLIDETWNPFKRLRLMQEMLKIMNMGW